MTSKLTIIVGLPGSGKSHFIYSRVGGVTGACIEDFFAFPYDDSRRFTDSKYYAQLINDLREGKQCIIADIFFAIQLYEMKPSE